jgi:hypothetical protein
MEKYTVTFIDLFSSAKEKREVMLTEAQHQVALRQMAVKTIVVDLLRNAIHWQFIIFSIEPFKSFQNEQTPEVFPMGIRPCKCLHRDGLQG